MQMPAEEVGRWLLLGLKKWQKEEKERRMRELENQIETGD